MKKIAIFASGTGSNARKIIEYFQDKDGAEVALVVSNRRKAPVLEMARSYGVDTLTLDRSTFYGSEIILDQLRQYGVDFVVLAGFLWLVPEYLVRAFENRMVNIHPALLPKYGGKGMYGMRVHQAVRESGDAETGITIHFVNERYDEGNTVFQARCKVEENDTPEDIAHKVQALEHRHFAPVIERLLTAKSDV